MWKSLFLIGILIVLIFLVGCTKANETLDLPAASIITTPISRTATITTTLTINPSPKTDPTKTVTPIATPSEYAFPQWNRALKLFRFDGLIDGVWAKTADAFLFQQTLANNPTRLIKVTAPEFIPVTLLSLPSGNLFEGFNWSPDNQFIIYTCQRQDHAPQLCIVGADGNNSHVINSSLTSNHFFTLEGWLDQQELLFTNYSGGGNKSIEIINIITGKRASWGAAIHGRVYPPHNRYIPATNDTNEYDFNLIAISEKYPDQKLDSGFHNGGNFIYLPEYRSIPRTQTNSLFEAWLPNSNVMLVFWQYYNPLNWEPLGHDLLLWDVDKNKVRLIAPGGKGGIFSSDGKLLAYLTSGPAKVDINSKPLAEEQNQTQPAVDYMQLLDMSTGKVQMSIPIISSQDTDDAIIQSHGFLNAQFSPDGRYLAFFTPGKVMENSSGWPIEVKNNDGANVELNLLDLQEKRIVWSITSDKQAVMSWSPVSHALVFQDQQLNWQLLNLKEYKTTPITLANGKEAGIQEWSYDGKYLSFYSQGLSGDQNSRSIISIIDLSQIK